MPSTMLLSQGAASISAPAPKKHAKASETSQNTTTSAVAMARPSLWLRALLMTNRFCIPMGARYARPNVRPWMNTDSKSIDIPYRPSKTPGIARRTTLLMVAYRDACGGGGGGGERVASMGYGGAAGRAGRDSEGPPRRHAGHASVPCSRHEADEKREQTVWREQGRAGTLLHHRFRSALIFSVSVRCSVSSED